MKLIEKFNKESVNNNRKFIVDTTHGVDVMKKIILPFLEAYNNSGVTILATGREQERILNRNSIDYKVPTDYFKVKNKRSDGSNEYEIIDRTGTTDLLIVWLSNFMHNNFIYELKTELSASLLAVGDSFLVDYFSAGDSIEFLHNANTELSSIDNLNDYSQELIYFINRVRNGEVEQLKNTSNRTYEITNKRPEIEELFEYDVAVTSNYYVGQTNRYIREMIFKNYELIPIKGDKMVAYELIQTTDKENEELIIEFGEELTVSEARISNAGYLLVDVITKDERVAEIWVDLNWLSTRYGEKGDHKKGGHKLFYSYVVPPEVMIDNSYESVFFEIKAGGINNKRVLYSVGSSARKKLKIAYSSDMSYLY